MRELLLALFLGSAIFSVMPNNVMADAGRNSHIMPPDMETIHQDNEALRKNLAILEKTFHRGSKKNNENPSSSFYSFLPDSSEK